MSIQHTQIAAPSRVQQWLQRCNPVVFVLFCGAAAFITYCSMYAFRKPFTAATFEGLTLWGMDYKIVLIITQVIGYTLSKFLGIKLVSELSASRRIKILFLLMGFAWASLFLFAITPYPYNFVWLFFNGLPLGMIWGVVFSFLEGRRFTELLGAAMASSFIVSSGFVKAGGKTLIDSYGVGDFWMPFLTGLLFLPLLLLGIWMLNQIPPPSAEDEQQRTRRVPMTKAQRRAFFHTFAPGIVLSVLIYVGLTIFRDIRDNFAVELWAALGYADTPEILVLSEIPIAVAVLVIIGSMVFIKNNKVAFFANQFLILSGGVIVLLMTFLFAQKAIDPALWMIVMGFGMYLPYIGFHTLLFERWIALFRYQSNIGYLMYISDAFGYLGSMGILLYKNFGAQQVSWLNFFVTTAIVMGVVTVVLSGLAIGYFWGKERLSIN
jgi:hypothetical protein